ncbi:MAG: serpin family protein [Clostridia bacterium]|nr:serpin family protein [Clostridia bacterium]
MKKRSMIAILMIFALGICGCQKASSVEELTASIEKREVEKGILDEDFYKDQLGFSWELFQRSAKSGAENVLISPLSVATALSMAANGADGKTGEEFLSVLRADTGEQLNTRLYSWRKALESEGEVKYRDANSIWIRDLPELEVQEGFLQDNVSYYDAEVFKAPFNKATLAEINGWVKEKTDGMIPKFLEHLEAEGALMLINAISFEGKWKAEYKVVQDRSFTALDGERQDAKMMCSTEGTYLENESAIGFLRPYNNQYSFGALLPKEKDGFEQYIQNLTAEEFGSFIRNKQYLPVDAALPKFKREYSLELNGLLSEMGMPSAFSMEQANFSKIAELPLYISRVLHQTAIEVDEQGTKASAVTGLGMNGGSSAPAEKKQVNLNRPFIYFILDNSTDLPIFIGTVTSLK